MQGLSVRHIRCTLYVWIKHHVRMVEALLPARASGRRGALHELDDGGTAVGSADFG